MVCNLLRKCARCGGMHRRLKVRRFHRPLEHTGRMPRGCFSAWMRCPATGDPIITFVKGAKP